LSPAERPPKARNEQTLARREELSRAGYGAVERGDYPAAERDFRRALAIAEGDATLFGLGVVCAMTDRTEEAFHLFERAVNMNGDDPDYWYNLGNAARLTMRPARALRAFERCLALGLEDRSLQRETEGHVQLLRKVIGEMQRDWGSHLSVEELMRHEDLFKRATEAMEREEYAMAAERFRESIALNERHYQSWGNLGTCLLGLGDLDGAERALRRALEIKPSYEPAEVNLETVEHVRAGEPLPPMVVINKNLRQSTPHLRIREAKTK
jgi:tetratricopeptide (TPR) repeat protein